MGPDNKGYILLAAILLISVILLIGASSAKLLISVIYIDKDSLYRAKVFCLSEAGIETAASRIASDETWSTDSAHSADDKQWLICAAKGVIFLFGDGGFKVVKENNKFIVYSVGFIGPDIMKSTYYSFQKMEYELPFKPTKWEEF